MSPSASLAAAGLRRAVSRHGASSVPTAMFRHAGTYMHWLALTHAFASATVALGGASGLVWLVWTAAKAHRRRWALAGRSAVGMALASVAATLWLSGTAPRLAVAPGGVTRAVCASLAHRIGVAPTAVSSPTWAVRASRTLLSHYAAYLRGRFAPDVPQGYRLVLVADTQETVLAPILTGNTAPLPVVASEVTNAILKRVPASTTRALAAIGRVAVGLTQGTAVTVDRHTPMLLMAVFADPGAAVSAARTATH